MIHSVTANRTSFRSVKFGPGLNVVLADRSEEATEKDTRNGLGKTTLIDIIDFCLGGSVRQGEGLAIEALAGWEFTLELSIGDERLKATRAVNHPSRIRIEQLGSGGPPSDTLFGETTYRHGEWNAVLSSRLFGLESENVPKYGPTYRSLISYFLRRSGAAYLEPFQYHLKQQPWNQQACVAYLLDLGWKNAPRWQVLKDKEKAVKTLQTAADAAEELDPGATIGALEVTRVRMENLLESESKALDNFKVHPQYASIQQEADRLTAELHEATDKNVLDRRMLRRYREAVKEEEKPPRVPVARLYEEAGVVFSDDVQRTLAETKRFRAQIIENRRQFLATEIKRIKERIAARDRKIRQLTEERAGHLEILKTHGAMQEMIRLQERIVQVREKLERVAATIRQRKELQTKKAEVGAQRVDLTQVARRDHEERRTVWSHAIQLFSENSEALYEVPGELIIDVDDKGFSYGVEINKSGSDGVDKMKIFCFDLMLLQSMPEHMEVDFLIHDSTIFDGVDSRQRARALERASTVASTLGKQYICTFNSDMVPRGNFANGFDFDRHVVLHLTDGDPSGSLLGFLFNR